MNIPRTALAAALLALAPAHAQKGFTFLHFSDLHIDAHRAGTPPPATLRGEDTIRRICIASGREQPLAPFGIVAPRPAFAIATGDLTEYGIIDDTWSLFEHAFAPLSCPLYVVAGNHDHTWVSIAPAMRRRHGGECYSFDHGGCHFIALRSASLQEPVPGFDARTRAWLARDLQGVDARTPIFLFFHHPLDDGTMAQPAEKDTLVDLLGDHNVALLLYGHGHRSSHHLVEGLDGVMGGSTFGPRRGYGIVHLRGDQLYVAYRSCAPEGKISAVLQKRISRQAPRRLLQRLSAAPTARRRLAIELKRTTATALRYELRVDGEVCEQRSRGAGRLSADLPALAPGMHLLSVRASANGGRRDLRTATFESPADDIEVLWRKSLPAAIQAAPLLWRGLLIIARNDGVLEAFDPGRGKRLWSYRAEGAILGTPAGARDILVFGDCAGVAHGCDPRGRRRWRVRLCPAGQIRPLVASVTIAGDLALVADGGGYVHALELGSGEQRWRFERAAYTIERGPIPWGPDLLVFGAWDGFLYAIDGRDGKLRWKSLGPKSSEGRAARYYAPADCAPVAIGERLFACARGYQLGVYSRAGELLRRLPGTIAAIAPSADGRSLYARGCAGEVLHLDARGALLWRAAAATGRFPAPPTERDGRLYVCSDSGLLQVFDAAGGKLLWRYQVTPGFHVTAAVAAGERGICYAAGMDGSVVAVRWLGRR